MSRSSLQYSTQTQFQDRGVSLAAFWPGLRYLSLGIWLAWAALAYSGTIWLSDVETDGSTLSKMYFFSTISNAVILLVTPFLPHRFKDLVSTRVGVLGAGLLSFLGALGIILAGPYFLEANVLAWCGYVATGVGTAVISLRIGLLYSRLQPWRSLVYALLSQLVIVVVFFFVSGNESYHPVSGGPSLAGMLAFTLLPVLAAALTLMKGEKRLTLDQEPVNEEVRQGIRSIPSVFWKFLLITFILTVLVSTIRGVYVSSSAPSSILANASDAMLLRAAFNTVMLLFAVRFCRHISFGKIYLIFMIAIAITITLMPFTAIYRGAMAVIIKFSSDLFSFLVWCLLAFIVFQKRVSAISIFGLGRGTLMAGSALGWFIGVQVMPRVIASNLETVVYISMGFFILVSIILIFSERDFNQLFSPISELGMSWESGGQTGEEAEGENGAQSRDRPYLRACRRIGEHAHLSAREQDVMEMLALGRGGDSIAAKLMVSKNTVRIHTHNVYTKLDIHSHKELVELIEEERNRNGSA